MSIRVLAIAGGDKQKEAQLLYDGDPREPFRIAGGCPA